MCFVRSVQSFYQGPRPQQNRNLNHRGGQGSSAGTSVVGMAGVGGGGGQPAIYSHPAGLPVQATGTMFVQSQVHGLHSTPHQQSVYMNNQLHPLHHQVLMCFDIYR